MEQTLIPYHAVNRMDGRRALVFAPHPDDEVFGCGGAILCHVVMGETVRVIVVTDGGFGVDEENRAEYVLCRQNESREAAKLLGYGEPEFWAERDRELSYGEKLVRRVMVAIQNTNADLVYAPSVFEMHPDHRALGMAVVEAVRRIGHGVRLALYEVGMPLRPNLLLDISIHVEHKKRAMECFPSQLQKQRYDQHISALNRFRCYTLAAEATGAEAYILACAEELAQDPFKLYRSEHDRQKELGLMLDGRDSPLVSVIIRSMDRPVLSEALDSVALQTYSNIEVVVVNARGQRHSDVGEWCGQFPLHLVRSDEPLHRSRAANMGLENARGEYMIFLDDDLFAPHHIAALQEGFENAEAVAAVYSAVRCINERGEETKQFEEDFDWTQLLIDNFMPIHAVLFRRRIVDAGVRFDETLDVCENWDFWFQVAEHGGVRFIPKVGATYRIRSQSGSGVWNDPVRTRQTMTSIYRKWLPRWTDETLWSILGCARYKRVTSEMRQQVEVLQQQIGGVQQQNATLFQQNEAMQRQNMALLQQNEVMRQQGEAVQVSLSWKVTAPLRLAGRMLRRVF